MTVALRELLRVTPQQLRAFEATARLGAVTRAARELHITQPTVSAQLKELAQTIGAELFVKSGRGIALTQAGEALALTINDIHDCWRRFETTLSDLQGLIQGRLRIAAVTTAEYFVPDLLGPFAAAYPGVDIELVVDSRERIVERMQRFADDVTVMTLPPQDLPLAQLPFRDNPVVVIAAQNHPYAGRNCSLQDLAEDSWLMREPGSGTRRLAEEHFRQLGFAPQVRMSLGSNEAIKHAVRAGLGLGVIAEIALQPLAPGLSVLRVEGFPLQRRWQVVYRRDRPLSSAAQALVRYLQTSQHTAA